MKVLFLYYNYFVKRSIVLRCRCIVLHFFADGKVKRLLLLFSFYFVFFRCDGQENLIPRNTGLTDRDLKEQLYRTIEKQMGHYVYRSELTPEENQKQMQQFIMDELHKRPEYSRPSAGNGFNQSSPQINFEKEMTKLLEESYQKNTITTERKYYNSSYYNSDLTNYLNAKQLITDMLSGKRELSVKDAYYFSEAAYGNLHLTYAEYDEVIRYNSEFIRSWLRENNYNLSGSFTPGDSEIHVGYTLYQQEWKNTGAYSLLLRLY